MRPFRITTSGLARTFSTHETDPYGATMYSVPSIVIGETGTCLCRPDLRPMVVSSTLRPTPILASHVASLLMSFGALYSFAMWRDYGRRDATLASTCSIGCAFSTRSAVTHPRCAYSTP